MENEQLLNKIDELERLVKMCFDRVTYLDNLMINEIINPISDAYSKREDEENYNTFRNKYGERLEPYNKMLSTIETDDTDTVRKAYDTYKSYDDDIKANFTEEQYIDLLCKELDNYFTKIRETLGVGNNADVSVTSTSDGDIEVSVDGQEIGVAEKEIAPTEETVAEETTQGEIEKPKKEMTDDEESQAFMQELLKDRERYMQGR